MDGPLLDRTMLNQAFTALARVLARKRVVGEIHVVGGAAMALSFDASRTTRDVDALFLPDTAVLDGARQVAREMGLPTSWLNQASSYVSAYAGRVRIVFDHPNLRVMATPTEHLLAMKVRAARAARGAEDVRTLVTHLGITTVDEVIALVERYFPDEPLPDRSRLLIEDILATE